MARRFLGVVAGALALAGCTVSTGPSAPVPTGGAPVAPAPSGPVNFNQIVARVEPVAEDMCRRTGGISNCDFNILLDERPGVPSNAYQTVDKSGRPLLIVTAPLLNETRNADELAFVLGHEAAHHINGHLPKTQNSAVLGAVLAGTIIAAGGGNAASVEAAQELGAQVGSRAFSKNFELEADAMGTVIAYRSGYDPVRGAEFFARIPDPGDRFLGTHPPNAERQRVVRQLAAQLQ